MKSKLDIDEVLRTIDVPASAWRVYKSLLKEGEVLPSTLSKSLNMPRASVYDQLRYLKDRGLVVDKDIDNKSFYSVAPLEDIESILEENIKHNQNILRDFKLAKSDLKLKDTNQAKIRFFETRESIERSLYNMLFSRNKIIYSLWPYDEMLKVLSSKKLEDLNNERVARGIKLKVIWPSSAKKNKNHIWQNNDKLIDRKYLASGKDFEMGYIICDNKVIFISSDSEGYAFIVDSEEFARTQLLHFNVLWDSAK